MWLICFCLKKREYPLGFGYKRPHVKFLSPEYDIGRIRIEHTKHIRRLHTNYGTIFRSYDLICEIVGLRFYPPSVYALVYVFKIVSHGHLPKGRVICNADAISKLRTLIGELSFLPPQHFGNVGSSIQ